MKKHIYAPQEVILEKVIDETPNIKTFVVKPLEPFSFKTGQFVELSVPGVGEAPFTPSSSPLKTERMEITIMKAGFVTGYLHEKMKGGEKLGIRGPYGTSYPVEKFVGKEVLILGGGVGLAPLRSLLYTLLSDVSRFKKILLAYGAKTPNDVVYKYLFPEWEKTAGLEVLKSVDVCPVGLEWHGEVGLVTCLLDKAKFDPTSAIAVLCGPPVMMKFSTMKLLSMGVLPENIYLSMEGNMSCGLGKCGHCQLGEFFICTDGPVFTYEKIKHIHDPFA
jgi:NAD(P)H-flavin reductase